MAEAKKPSEAASETDAAPADAPAANARTHSETLRKIIHIGTALPIFLIPFLVPERQKEDTFLGNWLIVGFALFLCLFNFFILPRTWIGRRVMRPGEGLFSPVRTYPLAILCAALAFPLHVLAAGWAVLAVGDGVANISGRAFGRKKLGWNRHKTYVGSLTGFAAAFGAAVFFVWYCHDLRPEWCFGLNVDAKDVWLAVLLTAFLAASVGMLIESVNVPFDDNFMVMQCAALAASAASFYIGGTTLLGAGPTDMLLGLLISAAFALLLYLVGSVTGSGAIVGGLLATVVYATLYWQGFLLLLLFVLTGTVATRLGLRRKQAAGAAQDHGGRRGAKHAFANLTVPALLALAFFVGIGSKWGSQLDWWQEMCRLLLVAFVGAIATALADTLATEIGLLSRKKPVLITRWRTEVEPGTNGGVTWSGLAASLVGGAMMAALAWLLALGTIYPQDRPEGMRNFFATSVIAVTIAAFLGSLFDSLLGATVEGKGKINNETVNLLSTLFGAAMAVVIQIMLWRVGIFLKPR